MKPLHPIIWRQRLGLLHSIALLGLFGLTSGCYTDMGPAPTEEMVFQQKVTPPDDSRAYSRLDNAPEPLNLREMLFFPEHETLFHKLASLHTGRVHFKFVALIVCDENGNVESVQIESANTPHAHEEFKAYLRKLKFAPGTYRGKATRFHVIYPQEFSFGRDSPVK